MTDPEDRVVTVMVIDDTPSHLALLEKSLGGHGCQVVSFRDGEMAVKAALAEPPDLVLLDIVMPGMDGFEVCGRFKANPTLESIPIIFVTALDQAMDKLNAFSRGGVDYITKPFLVDELRARVRAHLKIKVQRDRIEARHRQLRADYQSLQNLESQRDDLVQMLVHDLRAPLGAIGLGAELLMKEVRNGTQAGWVSIVERIFGISRDLQSRITEVLDVSRMEAGAMPVSPSRCDVGVVISSAVAGLGELVDAKLFRLAPPREPVYAFCDQRITERVFQNLIGNAIKFTGSVGTVEVSWAEEEDAVRVRVVDTGPGIPVEEQEEIFEKFGCGRGQQEAIRSTGLGLTFCKLAVEAQAGQIGLESSPGQGSVFWLTLPKGA